MRVLSSLTEFNNRTLDLFHIAAHPLMLVLERVVNVLLGFSKQMRLVAKFHLMKARSGSEV